MKKKAIKKLTLSKQTVSNLENKEMGEVKGGWMTATCPFPEFCGIGSGTPNCTVGCITEGPYDCNGTKYCVESILC